ncbi:MAG: tetratricopeptide repeat protein [Gammaproteobacteria bacterium]|nr:tetratricopeptide repeat protein [Gammaproteobacteria bacterium]
MEHPKQAGLDRFTDIVSGPDENINLAEAALLIAEREYPGLDPAPHLQRLDALAEQCRARLAPDSAPAEVISAVNRFLFEELGFHGDLETFNDPRNSFLNDVLERRQGIPISLSLVYIEIGRRLGLPVRGVSFPGHFLVKVEWGGERLVLDPFAGGRTLERGELERRLEHFSSERRAGWDLERLLAAASRKEILARMIRNLKSIYLNREDYPRALDAVNLILRIFPDAASELRDRAHVHDQMNSLRAAIQDYEQYLMLSPGSGDEQYICTRLADLKHSLSRLH